MADKKGKKQRYEVRLIVPLEVMAKDEGQAALIAMRWLLDTLIESKLHDGLTIYPPEPYRVAPGDTEQKADDAPTSEAN